MPLSRLTVLALLCLIVTGCANRAPARIALRADTLVVNTNQWTPLGITVLDARGRTVRQPPVRFALTPESLLALRGDGSISCNDDGRASVHVSVDSLRAAVAVVCHLARRFSAPVPVELVAGGPPVPFVMTGYDRDGKPIEPLRVELVTRDTTVVRLRGGLVYGLKPGATAIEAKSLGHSGGMVFWVRAPGTTDESSRRENSERVKE